MRFVRGVMLTLAGAFVGSAAAAVFVKRAMPSRGGSESDEIALVAIFDGVELQSRAQAFRGGSLFAWYGGLEVDLSEATLASEVHLAVQALLGGVAIRLPPGCRIEADVHALGGGVAVSKSEPAGEAAAVVKLDGLAVLGGVAVGIRRNAAT